MDAFNRLGNMCKKCCYRTTCIRKCRDKQVLEKELKDAQLNKQINDLILKKDIFPGLIESYLNQRNGTVENARWLYNSLQEGVYEYRRLNISEMNLIVKWLRRERNETI